jgi:CubicO group peptidase (beta-lactamase class C family)
VKSLLLVALMAQQSEARWEAVDRVIEDAIRERAFPGAVVAIGRRDTVLHLRAFGRQTYDTGSPAVTRRTVYDIASLTKVVGLTTAIMMLVDEGRVTLDSPLADYVPALGTAGPALTVRRALTHSAGFPAWRAYWQTARSRAQVFAMAAAEPLEYPTGTRMIYSDVGIINLTRMVEAVTGERLDRYLARRLFRPLEMTDTRYNPPRSWRSRIAPTEVDNNWRRRLVHGEVHDENTAAMGGISGHAGIFSTADDLARFARMMLRGSGGALARGSGGSGERGIGGSGERGSGGTGVGQMLVRSETIAEFTRVQEAAQSHRALGWETPNGQNSAGGRLSARAFGHTGFTGTSIWIDPELDLFVILLTNRVHPTRENSRVFAVRRAVADAAVEAVEAASR